MWVHRMFFGAMGMVNPLAPTHGGNIKNIGDTPKTPAREGPLQTLIKGRENLAPTDYSIPPLSQRGG